MLSINGPTKIASRYDLLARNKIINSLYLELISNVLLLIINNKLFKNILYHENVMAKLCEKSDVENLNQIQLVVKTQASNIC